MTSAERNFGWGGHVDFDDVSADDDHYRSGDPYDQDSLRAQVPEQGFLTQDQSDGIQRAMDEFDTRAPANPGSEFDDAQAAKNFTRVALIGNAVSETTNVSSDNFKALALGFKSEFDPGFVAHQLSMRIRARSAALRDQIEARKEGGE